MYALYQRDKVHALTMCELMLLRKNYKLETTIQGRIIIWSTIQLRRKLMSTIWLTWERTMKMDQSTLTNLKTVKSHLELLMIKLYPTTAWHLHTLL